MAFQRFGPRHPLRELRDEMDRLVSGFVGALPEGPWSPARGQPGVNLWELPECFKVELELPGVRNDQIELSVVGNELAVSFERSDDAPDGATYHRRERPVGAFTRVLRLPAEVNADAVEAQLRDGVLTVTLPKAETAKPKKIKVAGGGR